MKGHAPSSSHPCIKAFIFEKPTRVTLSNT